MPAQPTTPAAETPALHPRNLHQGRYDFAQLVQALPELKPFVAPNAYGGESVDFGNSAAVRMLNRALLKQFYGIEHWDIPADYLCPPIPGRADYLHYLADLLAASNGGQVPRGKAVRVLDVGVGANCIYPIIGHQQYGWHFVGSDTDAVAIRTAKAIVAANNALAGNIELRQQTDARQIFTGIVKPREQFDLTLCNPPFHASLAEAAADSRRKQHNLGAKYGTKPALNFGGQPGELWYPGGEEAFVRRMVVESAEIPTQGFWFTSLVSKKITLPGIYKELQWAKAHEVRTIEMAQGQKKSRFVAWTFLDAEQQQAWRQARWTKA
ncbi:23S rRNA (adenine(1618)-N(6))-methyltransferase RlmF [Hymenobacter fastidiosus]|uniref:Ribosomal RNA large subunit methyltransferase F n=1 Tax=Hymenobacter fastidiosus TaxID=486264 RepID=A0ABP7RYU0_9BACT